CANQFQVRVAANVNGHMFSLLNPERGRRRETSRPSLQRRLSCMGFLEQSEPRTFGLRECRKRQPVPHHRRQDGSSAYNFVSPPATEDGVQAREGALQAERFASS